MKPSSPTLFSVIVPLAVTHTVKATIPFSMPEKTSAPQDFGTLYRATVGPLRRYLARLLGNISEAQDIAHDAYLRMYCGEETNPSINAEAVLYVTARRLAINRLKRRNISPIAREPSSLDGAASTAPSVPQQVMARQELRILEEALFQLPPKCRAVLLLRKVELLTHREIADRLGIAISTVEKQHARALRLLRVALAEKTANGPSKPDSAQFDQEALS